MSPARCAFTRRCGISWTATTRWSRRRPPKSSSRTSSSAFWSARRPIGPPRRRMTNSPSGWSGDGSPAGGRDVAVGQCIGQDAPGAAALCDAWRRRGPQPSGAGVLPASRRLSRALPRMERGRSSARGRRASASGTAPQYCIETTAYQAGAEINIVMVLRDDTIGIYVWSESFRLGLGNWFETQQRIIRRIATSLERAVVDRAADAAGRRARRFARSSRPLAARPESHRRSSTRKAGGGRSSIFRDSIRENPAFSPFYSSLVQMNNIEHLVHPGALRNLDKAKATLELAKIAVELDPVDSGRISAAAGPMRLRCARPRRRRTWILLAS